MMRRPVLAPYFATTVEVTATLQSIGRAHQRDGDDACCLLLRSVVLEGRALEEDHLWMLVGENATTRLRKLGGEALYGSALSFRALVGRYGLGTPNASYCLAAPELLRVQWRGRERTLNTRAEPVFGYDEVLIDIEEAREKRRRAEQRPVMEAAASLRRDRGVTQALTRYARGRALPPAQFAHIQRMVAQW